MLEHEVGHLLVALALQRVAAGDLLGDRAVGLTSHRGALPANASGGDAGVLYQAVGNGARSPLGWEIFLAPPPPATRRRGAPLAAPLLEPGSSDNLLASDL